MRTAYRYVCIVLLSITLLGCELDTKKETTPDSALMANMQTLQSLESKIKQNLLAIGKTNSEISSGARMSLLGTSSVGMPVVMYDGVAGGSSGVSSTTLAEVGVDEGDLVKNDGRFLYVASQPFYGSSNSINIFELQDSPASAIHQGSIQLGDSSVSSLYLKTEQDSRELAVITGSQNWGYAGWYRLGYWGGNSSFNIDLFDVSDPQSVNKDWSVNIDGTYLDSRSIDSKLYIVSRYYPHLTDFIAYPVDAVQEENNQRVVDDLSIDSLLPSRRINGGKAALHVQADQCIAPKGSLDDTGAMPFIITITTIDLNNPDQMDVSCVLGEDSGFYASTNSLYLFNQSNWSNTLIHKFEFTAEGARYRASGQVEGNLGWNNPHLRMSEYENNLRVVTTQLAAPVITDGNVVAAVAMCCDYHHALHVLKTQDTQLVEVATLPNKDRPESIGKPGEDLYGVRFLGSRAYAVTYKRTDPLYTLDLSDPLDPKIAGQLKIPGFSSYLQPLGDNFILGVGNDSVEEGDLSFAQGVKMGLFDVSDLTSPRLVKEDVIGKRGSYSPVSYDYHALTLLNGSESNLYKVVLPVMVHDGNISWGDGNGAYYDWSHSMFRLYDIDLSSSEGFVAKGDLSVDSKNDDRSWPQAYSFRSVIQGGSVHFVYGNSVWSSSWQSPQDAIPASSAGPN